jgi:hypothetical protein
MAWGYSTRNFLAMPKDSQTLYLLSIYDCAGLTPLRRPIGRPQCGQRFTGDPISPRQAGHWIVSAVFSGAAGELPLFIRDQANGANRF